MRSILITNDDGIYSVGLKALAEAAIERGHKVTISAPSSQCSANSQHITLETVFVNCNVLEVLDGLAVRRTNLWQVLI